MAFVSSESLGSAVKDIDSSEWEYEYDETETESFYVTLDLPAPVSRPKEKSSSVRAASNLAHCRAHVGLDAEELGTPEDDPLEDHEPEERIQILDLHTENPIISYQNQTFSCQWSSTIGTDLLLTSPDSKCSFPKLLEGDGFDILATTNIKIVGQPVQLVPRYEAIVRQAREPSSDTIPTQAKIQSSTAEEPVKETPIRIPIGPESGRARHNQARFLERLMAAKSAKGDTDIIPLHPRKLRTGSGWRSWQLPDSDNADAAADSREGQKSDVADEGEDSGGEYEYGEENSERATSTPQQSPRGTQTSSSGVGRPRGGRRTIQTRARAMGGLFRDYRPHAGDADGADIRGIPDSTPVTWRQQLGASVPTPTIQTTAGEGEGEREREREGDEEVTQGDIAMTDA